MKFSFKMLFLITIGISSLTAGNWKSVGLDSLKVNCIISTHESIIAGTEKGLYFLDNDSLKQWIRYPGLASNISIQDINYGSNGELLVSAGGGSNSDGIYGGIDLLDGAPYYEFSLITYLDFPQAIGYYNDTLIVGSKNTLYYAIRDDVESLVPGIFFKPLETISIPPYSFGVEEPVVSDIYYSYTQGGFFVLGYDASPEPGRGSLLSTTTAAATEILDSSTTSIYEQYQGWSLNSNIFVGGLDGLYKSNSNTTIFINEKMEKRQYTSFEKIPTPNNQKVNHITGIMSSPIIIDGVADICIATNDGVFLKDYNDEWTEFGDIPVVPYMVLPVFKMAGSGSNLEDIGYIYAATNEGVYRYTFYDPTPISSSINKIKPNSISIKNHILKINTNNINSIEIFNIAGKKIFSNYQLNSKKVMLDLKQLNLSSGAYIVNIKNENNSMNRKFNYTR